MTIEGSPDEDWPGVLLFEIDEPGGIVHQRIEPGGPEVIGYAQVIVAGFIKHLVGDDLILFVQVYVRPGDRGDGVGSRLVQAVCDYADRRAFRTCLAVSPDDDSPLDYEATYEWYARFGFGTEIQPGTGAGVLYRNPLTKLTPVR